MGLDGVCICLPLFAVGASVFAWVFLVARDLLTFRCRSEFYSRSSYFLIDYLTDAI